MTSVAPYSRRSSSFSSVEAAAIRERPPGRRAPSGQPDPAGRPEHQQRLAGLQLPAVLQRVVRRAVGDEEGGRGRHVDSGGHLDRAGLGDEDTLGHATPANGAHDPIADGQPVDGGADALTTPETSPPGENGGEA